MNIIENKLIEFFYLNNHPMNPKIKTLCLLGFLLISNLLSAQQYSELWGKSGKHPSNKFLNNE